MKYLCEILKEKINTFKGGFKMISFISSYDICISIIFLSLIIYVYIDLYMYTYDPCVVGQF